MRYGLLIESGHGHQARALPPLDGTAQSLALVYDLLTKHPGWAPDRLWTLTTAALAKITNPSEFTGQLDRFLGAISPDDFLIVYYIGHARRAAEAGKDALTLALPRFDLPARTLISPCYLSPISRVFLVFDCCFAERSTANVRDHLLRRMLADWLSSLFEPQERAAVSGRARVIFTASQANERAFVTADSDGVVSGAFTRTFIAGCLGGTEQRTACNQEGEVTTHTLAEYVGAEMKREGRQSPVTDDHGAFIITVPGEIEAGIGRARPSFVMLPRRGRLAMEQPQRLFTEDEAAVAADMVADENGASVIVRACTLPHSVDMLAFTQPMRLSPHQFVTHERLTGQYALHHPRAVKLFPDGYAAALYAPPSMAEGAHSSAAIEVFTLHSHRVRRVGSPIDESVDLCLPVNPQLSSALTSGATFDGDHADDDAPENPPLRWLITIDVTGVVRVRSVLKTTADHLLATGAPAHDGRVRAAHTFSAGNHTYLVTGGEDGHVRIWDLSDIPPQRVHGEPHTVPSPRALTPAQPLSSQVTCIAVSASGSVVAAGYKDGHVCLWRAADGEPLRCVKAHATLVTALALSSDGLAFASGDGKGEVGVCLLAEESMLRRVNVAPVTGLDFAVTSLNYSRDGKILLVSAHSREAGAVVVVSDLEAPAPKATELAPSASSGSALCAICLPWSAHTYRLVVIDERGVDSRLLWWEEAE